MYSQTSSYGHGYSHSHNGKNKFYTPNEILLHNKVDDLWVSFLGKVYNLTPLCKEYAGSHLLKPLLAFAGKDISHWFNPKTEDLRTCTDPETDLVRPVALHGQFVHCPPAYPSSKWATNYGTPWWKEKKYIVGNLSKRVRMIRIINVLASVESTLEVCAEETMEQILERYLGFNSHASSYTWKYEGRPLNMLKTLDENGIVDDGPDFYQVNMPENYYYPAILLYFNDDLTVK